MGNKYFLRNDEILLIWPVYKPPVIGPKIVPGGENIKIIEFHNGK